MRFEMSGLGPSQKRGRGIEACCIPGYIRLKSRLLAAPLRQSALRDLYLILLFPRANKMSTVNFPHLFDQLFTATSQHPNESVQHAAGRLKSGYESHDITQDPTCISLENRVLALHGWLNQYAAMTAEEEWLTKGRQTSSQRMLDKVKTRVKRTLGRQSNDVTQRSLAITESLLGVWACDKLDGHLDAAFKVDWITKDLSELAPASIFATPASTTATGQIGEASGAATGLTAETGEDDEAEVYEEDEGEELVPTKSLIPETWGPEKVRWAYPWLKQLTKTIRDTQVRSGAKESWVKSMDNTLDELIAYLPESADSTLISGVTVPHDVLSPQISSLYSAQHELRNVCVRPSRKKKA